MTISGLGSISARLLLGAVLLFTVVSTVACTKKDGQSKEPAATGEYAGSEACKECHEEVYNGWLTTFHAYKFRDATPDFVIGDFERSNTLRAGDSATKMSRKGDEFFVTTIGPQGTAETFKIDYAVGSIWKQRYITKFPNGALQVLPVQWNVEARQWSDYHGPAQFKPGSGSFWSDPQRSFQFQCMGCHTTNSQVNFDAASSTYKSTWTRKGVGCESCHGAGGRHVRAPIPEKYTTIINPATMPDPRRAAMICGSCHTRGQSVDGKAAYPVAYRPGDQLNFLFDQNPETYPDRSPTQHHQQYDDWTNSGHAAAGVMCWDCHSPHMRGKSNRFQLKLPGSLLCETCHKVQPKGVHGLHSVNNCIGCHMPNTIKSAKAGDLRSHRFIVSKPALTVKSGNNQAKQPNSCNLCHYHKDYEPERLDHFLRAVKKPELCKQCHAHQDEDLDD